MDNLKKGQLCPACQSGKLDETRKNIIFKYKNRAKKFFNEKVFKCDVCGYEGLSPEASRKIEKELTDFRRKVDNLLSSDELRSIRENLGLSKKEMARRLSINAKTVGRYENGKITQSKQIDKLYRILSNPRKAFNPIFYNIVSADKLEQDFNDYDQNIVISSNQSTIPQRMPAKLSADSIYFDFFGKNKDFVLEAA